MTRRLVVRDILRHWAASSTPLTTSIMMYVILLERQQRCTLRTGKSVFLKVFQGVCFG